MAIGRCRPLVLGLSGRDGVGKSTVTRILAERLRSGSESVTIHAYGCFVCRRLAPHPTSATEHRDPSRLAQLRHRAGRSRCHAMLDAAELQLKLTWATRVATRGGDQKQMRVVLSDRTPLDGLAKFGLPPRSLAARLFRRAAARYDRIFLLEADDDLRRRRLMLRDEGVDDFVHPSETRWVDDMLNVSTVEVGRLDAEAVATEIGRIFPAVTGLVAGPDTF